MSGSDLPISVEPMESDVVDVDPVDTTPSHRSPPRSPRSPPRDPPRNDDGDIYCEHTACQDKGLKFSKIHHWKKHMDRHERPYKCQAKVCERLPGFTYPGGLRRHQREVHKLFPLGKGPLFCSFSNCRRGSGTPFTRKENLEDHERRHKDKVTHDLTLLGPPSSDLSPRASSKQPSLLMQPNYTFSAAYHQMTASVAFSQSQENQHLRHVLYLREGQLATALRELQGLRTLLAFQTPQSTWYPHDPKEPSRISDES